MKAVVLHYHLNPGGVTRIIESQIIGTQRISPDMTWMVLCGHDPHTAHIPATIIQVYDSLNYTQSFPDAASLEDTVQRIAAQIRKHLTRTTILHCHNPNLGKNPALTLAVYQLAREGYAVINHCHDFPEDRPANMELLRNVIAGWGNATAADVLYPKLQRYHFITLNSCDYRRIAEAGVPAARIHLFPNPVSLHKHEVPGDAEALRNKICRALGFDTGKKICTYPVRAITRKNLGEFLLLAVFFADRAHFTVTQPPRNPQELPQYNRWKSFCLAQGISIKFESGEAVNHEELINISDFCITTSVREGFGMAYLEPWLAGTPVIGRAISCITEDLVQHGLLFPRLYPAICIEKSGRMIDFKELTPADQEGVISGLVSKPSFRIKLLRHNPFLENWLDEYPAEEISMNRRIILEAFSPEHYGKKLLALYRAISE